MDLQADLQQLEQAFNAYQFHTQRSDIEYRKAIQQKITVEAERINQLTESLEQTKKQLNQALGHLTEQFDSHENWLNLIDRAIKTLRAESESRAKIAPQSLQTKESPKKTWLWR